MASWVVMGGKAGEVAHCTRCGEGLIFDTPQPPYMASAMMKAFNKHHTGCKKQTHTEPKPLTPADWFRGRDVGTSSFTIFFVMTGTRTPHRSYDVPHDPSDFGRCYRLLYQFPEWRARMPEVAERFKEWGPMVRRWDEMTSLYEEELPNGTAPKLYALMKELEAEGRLEKERHDGTSE